MRKCANCGGENTTSNAECSLMCSITPLRKTHFIHGGTYDPVRFPELEALKAERKERLNMAYQGPRAFQLVRDTDVAGVSGTGIVAEGCLFSNGKVTIAWKGAYATVGVLNSIAEVEAIHCHGGASRIVWVG